MRSVVLLSLFLFLVVSLATARPSSSASFRVETLLGNQGDVLWGFDFLPNGDVLLTKRKGELLRWAGGATKPLKIKNVPQVAGIGQGGLLDVRIDPSFATSRFIFLTHSVRTKNGYTTALTRAELNGTSLKNVITIFTARDASESKIQFGSRIAFSKDYLFVSIGDRKERKEAQNLGSHLGKILRLTKHGKAAPGNPFVKRKGALPEIWSYGHRNPEGLAIHPQTDELWEAEMGPRGGDEINLIQAGKNYGWPLATFGREYSGPKIGSTHVAATEQPIVYYVPSISPSGIAFYTGKQFPQWKDNLFVSALSGQHLRRLVVQEHKVIEQEVLLGEQHWRFRCVRTGPDGYLYFSTDEGLFARLLPNP